MKKWEYMWMYSETSRGSSVYVANGERLPARTNTEALNILGKDGWELVAIVPPSTFGRATQMIPHFCLKRSLDD